jgi:enoyl-CoA hydratase/carnithine racemase
VPDAPPSFSALRLSAEGVVGRLDLDRPERLNALSPQLLEELIDAAAWFDGREDVKVVVISGEGKAFCAGADIDAIARSGGDPDLGRRMADAIAGMRALTIAAVHGHCVGGGVVLAAACDLRVAARSARFSIPEVDLGIPLGWGGIPRLVRELGPAITKELVLTCRPVDAQEARALRFVNDVVPDEELGTTVERLAAKLAAQPAYSLELTKRHVNAVAEEAGSTAESAGDAESIASAFEDPESLEAMARYMAERGRR